LTGLSGRVNLRLDADVEDHVRATVGARTLLVTCLVTGGFVPLLASADTPTGVAVSSLAASDVRQQLVPLAGSPSRLIYASVPVRGDGVPLTSVATLESYDGSGAPTSIGTEPLGTDRDPKPFSLTKSMLSTVVTTYPATGYTVHWWNLATQTSGRATINGLWAGSSPDGWYLTRGHSVYDETTAGVVRQVATVHGTIMQANAGPDGVVTVGSSGAVSYVSAAGAVTKLAFSHRAKHYSSFVECGGTSATTTVCVHEPIQQVSDIRPATPQLISRRVPLNGQPSSPAPDACGGDSITFDDPDYFASSGSGITAAFTAKRLVCADAIVSSIGLPPGSRVHTSSYRVGSSFPHDGTFVVAALGKAVVASPSQTVLETISDAAKPPTRLLRATDAPITAGGFALSAGRIRWISDAATPASANKVRTAAIAPVAGQISIGQRAVVASGKKIGWDDVFASGDTIAYSVSTDANGLPVPELKVVSPYRTTVIKNVQVKYTEISGNRLLYLTIRSPAARLGRYLLLNVDTGKSKPVAALDSLPDPPGAAPKLWGNYIVYGGLYDPLMRLNLATGASIAVTAPGFDSNADFSALYGPYVGWLAEKPSGEEDAVYRDITHDGPTVVLGADTFVYALTNSGVVYGPDTIGYQEKDLDLRGYAPSSTSTHILTANIKGDPQVDSGILAWRDGAQVLRATPVPTDPLTPLSLGAPYAPKQFARSNGKTWDATAAFSAPLTSCAVTIAQAGSTVRTLTCDATEMTEGDATVHWDGMSDSDTTVAAGAYTWTATVQGTSGTVIEVSGTVTVTG
jgi:hypothetical protein